jgi:S-formylglutathione hydrolase FrmB
VGRRVVIVIALVAGALAFAAPAAPAVETPAGCTDAPVGGARIAVVVDQVVCQQLYTDLLGNHIKAPFEYYVPPTCAPALGVRCPVLYLLHGFGGDFTEMVGEPGAPSPWVRALTSAPPAGFESSPRSYADPATWVARPPIAMILVAPRGRTLPNGYGPAPDLDSYWGDWNPRYALGGDSQRYDTPAPRFESFLTEELAPFVEANLPAGTGREWRAIGGVSLGGYGAYKNGLQHPDEWTSMLSVSGAHNFLFAPGLDASPATAPAGIAPLVATPAQHLPGPTGAVPIGMLPSQASTFLVALDAFGDPVADEAYFRGNMPRDLAMNALAFNDGHQVFGIDGFWNDLVAEPQDAGGTPFEVLVTPMNVDMQAAFTDAGVEDTWAIHPGNHSDVYRNAWYRGLLEFAYARLQHPDGNGTPPASPTTFNYRSINRQFSIWGWHFDVVRDTVEFLTLKSVSCSSITLQGSGLVTFTVPSSCGARPPITVDLGPSLPTDEQGGAGAAPVYGNSVTVQLG